MSDDDVFTMMKRSSIWGYGAIVLGGLGLLLSMVVIFGGPFTPQPSVGETIGEIAGDIRASALRSLRGDEPAAPTPKAWNIDQILILTAPVLGALGILAAVVSALVRDPWRMPTYGALLGGSAIVFQFVWWLALLVCGVLLLVSIIENMGNILDGFGG
jgi:hypothetical protein